METLSDRINRLSESQTLAMSRKSRELQAQGLDIINLSLGEPDFDTPGFIKDAAKQAIDENYTKYMAVNGYLDLREAIARKFERDNGLTYTPEQIVVSTGAKQCIANVVMCLIDKGDEVLIPAPFWVTYAEIVKMANGTPVLVEAGIDTNFKLTASHLDNAITKKTKLIIFSSPCNPTGSVYNWEELKQLADVISNHENLYVIADEIYEHINFVGKNESLAQFDHVYDRVITINGVSKAWAMTGWRLGYLAAPLWIAQACTKMQGQITSGTCGISQRAAKAAVEADPAETNQMVAAFKARRDMVVAGLRQIPGLKVNEPEGAFYIFPDVSSYFGKSKGDRQINNADDLCLYLLEDALVATVTGAAFGADNYIRISYAASEEQLNKAIDRIASALAQLS